MYYMCIFSALEAHQPVHSGQGCLEESVLGQSVQAQTETRLLPPGVALSAEALRELVSHPAGKSPRTGGQHCSQGGVKQSPVAATPSGTLWGTRD